MKEINYIECANDFAITLNSELEKMIERKLDEIEIKNIPSGVFCDVVGCEPDDFNGWQCDWWSKFTYHNRAFNVSGCAWDGTVGIGLE